MQCYVPRNAKLATWTKKITTWNQRRMTHKAQLREEEHPMDAPTRLKLPFRAHLRRLEAGVLSEDNLYHTS